MMAASQAHERIELKKSPWTPEEDQKLIEYVETHDKLPPWREVAKRAGLSNRSGKSCRLRWTKYLKADIKRGKFSQDEEDTIVRLHSRHGNSWALIATHLPGRTDNEIKNFWNTRRRRKLRERNIPPATQTPLEHLLAVANLLASTAVRLRGYVHSLHIDARPPNPHLWHNPVPQRFGYVKPDPQSQPHGLGFNSTDPAQTLPSVRSQAPSFNFNSTDLAQTLPSSSSQAPPGFNFNSTDPARTLPSTPSQAPPGFNITLPGIPSQAPPGLNFNSTDPDQTLPSIPSQASPDFNFTLPGIPSQAPSGFNFNSTDPAQTLPSSPSQPRPGFNFNSTDPAQTLPSIPSQPPPSFNFNSTDPTQSLASISSQASGFNSDGFLFTPDEERANLWPTSTDSQACKLPMDGFNYQAMEYPTVHNYPDQFGSSITSLPNTGGLIPDPQVNNNSAADLGSSYGNVPSAGWIPTLMVSGSSERSMTNKVENEITPPAEEISKPSEAWLEELLSAETGETSDSFCGDIGLV